jgi:hypothetical protein
MIRLNKRAMAVGLAGAMVLSAVSPSFAAPVMTSTAVLKAVQPGAITEVRWRGRGWRGRGLAAAGIGLFAGALIGSVIARAQAYPYYYDGGPYDSAPVYAAPPPVYVEPGAVYAAPEPAYPSGCWITTDKDRGYGYWGAC